MAERHIRYESKFTKTGVKQKYGFITKYYFQEELSMSKKMIYASPKGENIVFDNWTENEEFEGLWVDLCPECPF